MSFPGSKVPVDKRATLMTPTAKKYARCAVAQVVPARLARPVRVPAHPPPRDPARPRRHDVARPRSAVARSQIGHEVMVSPYWVHELALWVQAPRHRRKTGGECTAAEPR